MLLDDQMPSKPEMVPPAPTAVLANPAVTGSVMPQKRCNKHKRRIHDEACPLRSAQEQQQHNHGDPKRLKKKKMVWSEDMHRKFMSIVFSIGLKHAKPSKIKEQWDGPGKVSLNNLKSHLQKCREHGKITQQIFDEELAKVCAKENKVNRTARSWLQAWPIAAEVLSDDLVAGPRASTSTSSSSSLSTSSPVVTLSASSSPQDYRDHDHHHHHHHHDHVHEFEEEEPTDTIFHMTSSSSSGSSDGEDAFTLCTCEPLPFSYDCDECVLLNDHDLNILLDAIAKI